MKTIYLIFLVFLICGCGVSTQPEWTVQLYDEVFGPPQIMLENVCYYFGIGWPGCKILKIHFEGNKILKTQIRWIEKDDLYYYVPLLIEMIKTDNYYVPGALGMLNNIMSVQFTIGGFVTDEMQMEMETKPWYGKDRSRWNKTTYQKWKDWYETEGRHSFDRWKERSKNKNKTFY